MSADPIATLSEAMQAVVDDLRAELATAQARIARLEAAQVTPSMLDAALIEGGACVAWHGMVEVATPVARPSAPRPPVAAPASPGRFRVGQRVRVTRPQNQAESGMLTGWMSSMDIYDGAECTLSAQTSEGWWNLTEDPTMWDFHPDWLTPIETLATAPEAQAVPFDEVGVAFCCALPPEQRRAYREIRR